MDLVAQADERELPQLKNRRSRVVLGGMIVAYGTHVVATRAAARRAIVELRLFRPRLKGLLEALNDMDRDLAAQGLEPEDPPYAHLGVGLLNAVEAVSKRLETRDDTRRVPTTRAQWRQFTGTLAHSLRTAGMPWADIAKLLPERNSEQPATKDRLRKRAERFKKTLPGGQAKKKGRGRLGAPERPQAP
ncbi:MAG TPA: hypothetical protein VJV79_19740 [Polyangiaceae bacterium]|nr:hypothetical protein [Polyangiaceae bacterium]